jgi:hypothetical protein
MKKSRVPLVAVLAFTLTLAISFRVGATVPAAERDDVERAVAAVRAEYATVEAAIGKKELRLARMSLGGGQNPGEITVHYRGGTPGDFEQDPYAAPFVPRRVVVHRILPAVGDAWARFTFDASGALVFAFTTGPDISGVTAYELRPAAELRVWFRDGEPIRVVHPGPDGGLPRTVDLGLEKDPAAGEAARSAALALLERGRALAAALGTLAR